MNLQKFSNPQFGNIRTLEEDESILFCGNDVASALGYKSPKDAVAAHCKGAVKRRTLTVGGEQDMIFISEGDIYRLAARSKLPGADEFERWIFDEVLPSIRKTGSYRSLPVSPAEQLLAQAQLMVEQERRLKAVEEKTQATQETVQSAFSALSHPTVSRDHWQDETRSQIRRMCLENGLNYQTHTAKLYEELESEAHVNLETRVKRLRDRMKTGGAKYAERQAVNKLTVIAQDPKLRSIFSSVIQRRYAQLVTEKLSAM